MKNACEYFKDAITANTAAIAAPIITITVPPVNVNDYIMLMPEGITEKAIISKSDECVQKCISHGWTFSSRMHILIWGNVKEK